MLSAELRVTEGKHQGKSIPLNVKQFLVGREADCHLRPNSDLVSRHHCVFLVDDYTVRLRDLGSTNGTFVNGEKVEGQVVLKEGDEVHIGKLVFRLEIRKSVPVAVPVGASGAAPMEAPAAIPADQETVANVLDTQEIPSGDHTLVAGGSTIFMPAPKAPAAPATSGAKRFQSDLPVRLPDPESTGAKDVVIGSGGSPTADAGKDKASSTPSTAAADIIKNRMLRRPKPGG